LLSCFAVLLGIGLLPIHKVGNCLDDWWARGPSRG
jgi:hypothetical protein